MISEVPNPSNIFLFVKVLTYDIQCSCKILQPSMTLFGNFTYLIPAQYSIVSRAEGILKVLHLSSGSFEVHLLYITAPLCKLQEGVTLLEKKYDGNRNVV